MKKFLVLYMAPLSLIEEWTKSTKEDQDKGMAEWMKWHDAHKDDVVELGAPAGKNKRITGKGVSDIKNEVCGYSIVQAKSHDDAAELLADNPHVKQEGAWVDVLECLEMS